MRQRELSCYVAFIFFMLLFFQVLFSFKEGKAKDRNRSSPAPVKIIYKYKKFEEFDFEAMEIKGEIGSPGELSITPGYKRKFRNILPYRKNFNAEIKKAVERIR